MSGSSLLLSFRLENFRSFRGSAVMSFVRGRKNLREELTFPDVAPVLAIFGPNASGKSNVLRGLSTMFEMIEHSASRGARGLPYSPYLPDRDPSRPTTFEVSAILDGVRYDYSFSYDGDAILSESLTSYPRGRPRLLFERDTLDGEDRWSFGDSMTGPSQALGKATRRHALLLTTANLISHDVLTPIQERFTALIDSIDAENLDEVLQRTLASLADSPQLAAAVGSLLAVADIGVSSIRIEQSELTGESLAHLERVYAAVDPDATLEEVRDQIRRSSLRPMLEHTGENGETFNLPFKWESVGTRNFLTILGPVLGRLVSGGVLVVDELDTSLHPRLVSEIVRLFQMEDTNPHQAQLIISTHDVTVMMNTGDYDALERDQVWFVQKREGHSDLYSLDSFKRREGEVFSRAYLNGRFEALPRVDRQSFRDAWPKDLFES